MAGAFTLSESDRQKWRHAADWLVVAMAVVLPWSTSVTLIAAALWLVAVLPTIERDDANAVLASPAAWLVLAFMAFGAIGMLWGDISFKERIRGFDSFLKFLAIPLLFMQFRRSVHAERVLVGFIASCTLLLVFAVLSYFFWAELAGFAKTPGVPVKDYISQGAMFSLAAMFCFVLAMRSWGVGARNRTIGFLALGLAFILDIAFLISSRTALVSVPILLMVLIAKELDWRRSAIFAAILILAGIAIMLVPSSVQSKLAGMWQEIQAYQTDGRRTSAGERIEFWKKSAGFIAEAPLFGHGTGSIRSQFERVATGEGASALIAVNPHNQTLAVGIQLGFAGMLLLYAMWIAHLVLFRGHGIAVTVGALVVVQNIVGSAFNSHLFDFTHGWLYVLGVGVAGGVAMAGRRVAAERPLAAAARP